MQPLFKLQVRRARPSGRLLNAFTSMERVGCTATVTRQAKDPNLWIARITIKRDGSLTASATKAKYPRRYLAPKHLVGSVGPQLIIRTRRLFDFGSWALHAQL